MADDFVRHEALTTSEAPGYVITNLHIDKHETRAELRKLADLHKADFQALAEVVWSATLSAQKDAKTLGAVQKPEHYIDQALQERKTEGGRYKQGSAYLEIKAKSSATNVLNPSKLVNISVDLMNQLAEKFPAAKVAEESETPATDLRVNRAINLKLQSSLSKETRDGLKELDFTTLAAVLWAAKTAKEKDEKIAAPATKRSTVDDFLSNLDAVLDANADPAKKPAADGKISTDQYVAEALRQSQTEEGREFQLYQLDLAKRIKSIGGGIKTDEDAVAKSIEALAAPKARSRSQMAV